MKKTLTCLMLLFISQISLSISSDDNEWTCEGTLYKSSSDRGDYWAIQITKIENEKMSPELMQQIVKIGNELNEKHNLGSSFKMPKAWMRNNIGPHITLASYKDEWSPVTFKFKLYPQKATIGGKRGNLRIPANPEELLKNSQKIELTRSSSMTAGDQK